MDPKYKKIIRSMNIKTTKSGKFVDDPYKILYMIENNECIVKDSESRILKFNDIFKIMNVDPFKFSVYRYFKKRGYEVRENEYITIIKNDFIKNVFVKRPYENVYMNFEGILALVDDYFENTFYSFDNLKLEGKNSGIIEERDSLLGENPVFLDERMRIVHNFLINMGITLKSGMKFGCEFLGYVNPTDEHSKYMIKIVRPGMTYIEAAGLARVAHATRKTLILIETDGKSVNTYRAMEWIKI
ncbi:MAG: hypothetical protein ACP5L4_03100 [Thermoplasmata archaeon]